MNHDLLTEHDRALSPGQMCYARWDYEGPARRAYCIIQSVSKRLVLLQLLERLYEDKQLVHRISDLVRVPRYGTEEWNKTNCIEVSDAQ